MGILERARVAVIASPTEARAIREIPVWFIQGLGKPRRYFLEGNFVVDSIEDDQFGDFRYRMSGPGKDFDTQTALNDQPWFSDFLSWMANFSRGFTRLDKQIVKRFMEVASK